MERDCGLCGARSCAEFSEGIAAGTRVVTDCPFYRKAAPAGPNGIPEARPAPRGVRHLRDVLGHPWDFVLAPLPGEPSARKIVLPFRPDLVEKWGISKGDIVLGRPAGAGCPVQHVLEVIQADPVSGVLETWVVGPAFSRGRTTGGASAEVKDVVAYHMLGFAGLATEIRHVPCFGARQTFLPGFCMMHLNHTGLVNLVLQKESGLQVRLEDIRILAGPP